MFEEQIHTFGGRLGSRVGVDILNFPNHTQDKGQVTVGPSGYCGTARSETTGHRDVYPAVNTILCAGTILNPKDFVYSYDQRYGTLQYWAANDTMLCHIMLAMFMLL